VLVYTLGARLDRAGAPLEGSTMRPMVSVVIPMHNEAENVRTTLTAIAESLRARGWTYEIVPVNDGSTDSTAELLSAAAADDPRVRPVIYHVNRGRGYALRQGFAAARGDLVASLDADLSYSVDVLTSMLQALVEDPEADIVLGSQCMPGGRYENVPFVRLFYSRVGNIVLRASLPRRVYTSTSVARAYRRDVLRSLNLESDGKEIHLEILAAAMALGYRIVEIPVVLSARTKGHSKFKPRRTVQSHLLFSVLTRSATLFAWAGMALLLLGIVDGGYLLTVFFRGGLNPERPLMTAMLLLLLGGTAALAFAVLASQLIELKRAVVRLQAEVRGLDRSTADDEHGA
jgi:glycosyltransferase involved in cell wall biosynthesis